MHTILQRLAREPAAIGALLTSVLPALVVLGVITLDEQAIAAIVVIVNAITGFAVRLLVTPNAQPAGEAATLDPLAGESAR
jgi:hypothetical protein